LAFERKLHGERLGRSAVLELKKVCLVAAETCLDGEVRYELGHYGQVLELGVGPKPYLERELHAATIAFLGTAVKPVLSTWGVLKACRLPQARPSPLSRMPPITSLPTMHDDEQMSLTRISHLTEDRLSFASSGQTVKGLRGRRYVAHC